MASPSSESASNNTPELLLAEAREQLRQLEAALPDGVDGYGLSQRCKLPFKVLWYREAMFWRTVQLGKSALENFDKDKLVSAILLTRATVETCAALWFLSVKLKASIESRAAASIDPDLMRLLMGSKVDQDILPPPVNVLSFVDRVEKDIPGFRRHYDRLSEFAHPNWAGTAYVFSKPEPGSGIARFGEQIRGAENVRTIGLSNLTLALMVFRMSYEPIGDLMPDFIRLCEQNSATPEEPSNGE